MTDRVVTQPKPWERILFDGERCTPWVRAPLFSEHMHRYLAVLDIAKGRRVLDIACGEGYGSALISASGASSVIGMDIDAKITARAQRIYGHDSLRFEAAALGGDLPLDDDSVDLITCFETIEHLEEQDAALDELKRILAPGGILAISTPDAEHPVIAAHDNPYHMRELTQDELRDLVSSRFPHCKGMLQRIATGSVLVGEDGTFGPGQQFWDRTGFLEYTSSPTLRIPQYLILWASDVPLPPLPTGIMHDNALAEIVARGNADYGTESPMPPELLRRLSAEEDQS